jgi:hypothetical protein
MKLHVFPSRQEVQGKWWHAFAKLTIYIATFLSLLLGIFIAEYDDAPGAVFIVPFLMFSFCVLVYHVLIFIVFGRESRR